MLQINLADNDIGGYYDDENELISTPEGPKAIADAIRVSRSLTECNVRGNALDVESAKLLAKVATEKRVMLFGITHDQRVADFQGKYLKPPDAVLIANDISVSRSLKQVLASSLHLLRNTMFSLLSSHAQIDLSNNHLCGVWESINGMEGRYSAVGIKAIAHAVGRGSLSSIVVGYNFIGEAAALELLAAMKDKDMVSIGMAGCQLGVEGAKAVAEMAAVSRSLTQVLARFIQPCSVCLSVLISGGLMHRSTSLTMHSAASSMGGAPTLQRGSTQSLTPCASAGR